MEPEFPGIALGDTITAGEITGVVLRIDRRSVLVETENGGEVEVQTRDLMVTARRVRNHEVKRQKDGWPTDVVMLPGEGFYELFEPESEWRKKK